MAENAVAPEKAHPSDAGFDLTAASHTFDDDGNYIYGTGIAVEIPNGHVGLLFPRSSIAKTALALTNSVGVIDSSFRGEILFKFKPALTYKGASESRRVYSVGDRIGQLIIMPYQQVEFEEADELSESDRGKGGFGSTGE